MFFIQFEFTVKIFEGEYERECDLYRMNVDEWSLELN